MCVRRPARSATRLALLAGLVLSAGCHRGAPPGADPDAPPPTPGWRAPRSGLEVIGWMRRVHPSRALRSLSFALELRTPQDSSSRQGRGYALLPGRFRVDLSPARARTAWVRNGARQSVFERGRCVMRASRMDLATLVAFDVFAQDIDATIRTLDSSDVRYGLLREDALDGRRVWVVGAPEGDTSSAQFWVDADRWRVVRVIQPDARSTGALLDIRFTEFADSLDVPVPTRVELRRNGRLVRVATLTDIHPNPRLSARDFDVSRWRTMRSAGSR